MKLPTTMQADTTLSPSLQVLFLQLFNMAVQNISNSTPVPGLENVCVSNRDQLKAVRLTMDRLINDFDEQGKNLHNDFREQGKKIERLNRIIEKKSLEQIDGFKEVAQNSNSALKRMFHAEFGKLGDQITAQYQTYSVCEGIRKENAELKKLKLQQDKEYLLYKDAMKQLVMDASGIADILLNATKAGNTALVKVLVDAGVNVDVADSDRFTPLHWAARRGYPDIVQILLDAGAKVDAKTVYGDTPLGWAANNGDINTCMILLAAGANVQETQSNGWTALHIAAYHGHPAVCRLLLDSGAKIDALDNDKNTALHRAASNNHADVVRLLLARGANRNLKNGSGKTPRDIARDGGYTDVVAALSAV